VKPVQLRGAEFTSNYNPGEIFSCIVLNAIDETYLENISFDNVHVSFPGGGTAEQAAVRNVPKIIGEYYQMGIPPAYGMYARNVRGLTMHNMRFEMQTPDLRPALVFDDVSDVSVLGLSAQGNAATELLRFTKVQDTLLSATRILTPAATFLNVEGTGNENITIDGGDLRKAAKLLKFENAGEDKSVKLRV
jgi:hypothetical protein